MFKIDDPTAAASLPTPAAAGTQGYFTEGNPGAGTAATRVTADFLNMLQGELISILTAASVTPSKTTYNQVLTAINTLISNAVSATGIGVGQSYTDVTASRSLGTTYTNSTSKSILVIVYTGATAASQYVQATVGSVVVARQQGDTTNGYSSCSVSFIVPPGATYSVSGTRTMGASTYGPSIWAELR